MAHAGGRHSAQGCIFLCRGPAASAMHRRRLVIAACDAAGVRTLYSIKSSGLGVNVLLLLMNYIYARAMCVFTSALRSIEVCIHIWSCDADVCTCWMLQYLYTCGICKSAPAGVWWLWGVAYMQAHA